MIAVQIGLLALGFSYSPEPQDLIHRYDVTIVPQKDGSLDMTSMNGALTHWWAETFGETE